MPSLLPSFRVLRCLAAAAILSCSSGDGGSEPDPTHVAFLRLFPDSAVIFVGDSLRIVAQTLDSAGLDINDRTIAWTVRDTSLLGPAPGFTDIFLGGRKPGTSFVVGAVDGLVDSTSVRVRPHVATVMISPRPASMVIGDTIQFTAVLLDAGGDTLVDERDITWEATGVDRGTMHFVAVGKLTAVTAGPTILRAFAEGKGDSVALNANMDTALVHVAAGENFGCAVSGRFTPYCWGYNGWGAIGLGTVYQGSVLGPTAVPGDLDFSLIAAGLMTACGLTTGGAVLCWGGNDYGKLGNASGIIACQIGSCRGVPLPVIGAPALDSLDLGVTLVCGVTSSGAGYCWGSNHLGQLGIGSSDALQHGAEPVAAAGPFRSVAAGSVHACALDLTGLAWCWGGNQRGELGRGFSDAGAHAVPDTVNGGMRFQSLSAAENRTCGLAVDGSAWCWGTNEFNQLGLGPGPGDTVAHPTPAAVSGGLTFRVLTTGDRHTCGIATDNLAYCWGDNEWLQLGVSVVPETCLLTYPCTGSPVAVSGGLSFVSISVGIYTTCGLASDGLAYCWGANGVAQLGNGGGPARSIPWRVAGQP